MKMMMNNGVIRGIPLALLITVLVQGGAAVWWVSAKARDSFFLEQRVTGLETSMGHATEVHAQLLQRLARIEERVDAQIILLGRIEKQLTYSSRP